MESLPQIMAILNATKDSFFDGGRFFGVEEAKTHVERLIHEGANILDIGAESSRPGSKGIPLNEEVEKVTAILEAISPCAIPISIDTSRVEVAERALTFGCEIINDIYSFQRSPELAGLIADKGCKVVLMHMAGTPETMQNKPHYESVVGEVLSFFEERISFSKEAGIKEEQIILDPGIGFGKTLEHNLSILRNLDQFSQLGFPLLVGPSRKAFIGELTNQASPEDRIWGTAGIIAYLALQGINILRVHDVKPMVEVVQSVSPFIKEAS